MNFLQGLGNSSIKIAKWKDFYVYFIVCLINLLLLELVKIGLSLIYSNVCLLGFVITKKLFLFDLTHFSRMNWKDQKDQSSLFNRFFIFYLNSFFKRNVFKKQNFERKLKFKALHLIWFTNNRKELSELVVICCLNLI